MELAPSGPVWIGVDIGTQSVRVMIVGDDGTVLSLGSEPLRSHRGDGVERHHEQDPHQWWEAVGRASRQAFAGLPAPVEGYRTGGVAICSTSGTVLLTDDRGRSLTPALMYDDARAGAELAEIVQAPQAASVQLSWALPKISWLLRHHTMANRSRCYVAHSADYIGAGLTGGRVATDTSHSLKSGYDVAGEQWDPVLLEAAGVSGELMPTVVRPGSTIGQVSPRAAQHTGIPAGTPVLAGMTDGCAAQIAAGALAPGAWNSVLGTTLVLKGVSRRLLEDPAGAVYSHRHPDGGWLPGGASNVGAGAVAVEFGGLDLDQLSAEAQAFEPAPAVVYPLTASGERFPFVAPAATRFELGTSATAAERYAALIQGVAFVERLAFEHLAAIGAETGGEISITGGATANSYWNQIRADVLNRPLGLPATPEPSFGMAVLASAQGTGVTERAARMVTRRAIVEPRPGAHDRFAPGYAALVDELIRRGHITDAFTTDLSRSSV